MQVLVLYGSTMGRTESVARKLAAELEGEVHPATAETLGMIPGKDVILLGSSTWGYGDLQDDWSSLVGTLRGMDLSGKTVAFFGSGDQEGYGDTFVDAMGILYDAVQGTGARCVGAWPTEGYRFSSSRAVRDGVFVGLPVDEDNQSGETEGRIAAWVGALRGEIGA